MNVVQLLKIAHSAVSNWVSNSQQFTLMQNRVLRPE